jgi:hypothetical protein
MLVGHLNVRCISLTIFTLDCILKKHQALSGQFSLGFLFFFSQLLFYLIHLNLRPDNILTKRSSESLVVPVMSKSTRYSL